MLIYQKCLNLGILGYKSGGGKLTRLNFFRNSSARIRSRRPAMNVSTQQTTNTNEKSQINSCLRKAFKVLQILSMPLQVAADGVEKLEDLGKDSKPALNSLDAVGHSLGILSAPLDM